MRRTVSKSVDGRSGNPDHKQRLLEISEEQMRHDDHITKNQMLPQQHQLQHHHQSSKYSKANLSLISVISYCIFYLILSFEAIEFITVSFLYLFYPNTTYNGITPAQLYQWSLIMIQSTIIVMCVSVLIRWVFASHIESQVSITGDTNTHDNQPLMNVQHDAEVNVAENQSRSTMMDMKQAQHSSGPVRVSNPALVSGARVVLPSSRSTSPSVNMNNIDDINTMTGNTENAKISDESLDTSNININMNDNNNNHNNNESYSCCLILVLAIIKKCFFQVFSMEWTEFNLIGICSVSYFVITAILCSTNTKNNDLSANERILCVVSNILSAFGFVLPGICVHLYEKEKRKVLDSYTTRYYPDYNSSRHGSSGKSFNNIHYGNYNYSDAITRGGRGERSVTDPQEKSSQHWNVNSMDSVPLSQYDNNNKNKNKTIGTLASLINDSNIRRWFVCVFTTYLVVEFSKIFLINEIYFRDIYYVYFYYDYNGDGGSSPNGLQKLCLFFNYIILKPFSVILIVNTLVLMISLAIKTNGNYYSRSQFSNIEQIFSPSSTLFMIIVVIVQLTLQQNAFYEMIISLVWIGVFIFISVFECWILLPLLDIKDAAEKEKERIDGYKKTSTNIFYVVGCIVYLLTFLTCLLLFVAASNDSAILMKLVQPIGITYFNLCQIIMLYPLKTISQVPSFCKFSGISINIFFYFFGCFCIFDCSCVRLCDICDRNFKKHTNPKYLYMFRVIAYINTMNLIFCLIFFISAFGTPLLDIFNFENCSCAGDGLECLKKNVTNSDFDHDGKSTPFMLSVSFIWFGLWSLEEFLHWIVPVNDDRYTYNLSQMTHDDISRSGLTFATGITSCNHNSKSSLSKRNYEKNSKYMGNTNNKQNQKAYKLKNLNMYLRLDSRSFDGEPIDHESKHVQSQSLKRPRSTPRKATTKHTWSGATELSSIARQITDESVKFSPLQINPMDSSLHLYTSDHNENEDTKHQILPITQVMIDTERNLRKIAKLKNTTFDRLVNELQLPLLKQLQPALRQVTIIIQDIGDIDNTNKNDHNTEEKTQVQVVGSGNASSIAGVSSVAASITIRDPLVVMLGIGEYKGMRNLAGILKDYDNLIDTFVNYWKYKVFYRLDNNKYIYSNNKDAIETNYKVKWNEDEIVNFVEESRKCIVKNKHDGILFAISSHGDTGRILYDSECSQFELDYLFSMYSPDASALLETYQETQEESNHLLTIPKIFFLDMCRGDSKAKVTQLAKSTGNISSTAESPQNEQKLSPLQLAGSKSLKQENNIISIKGISKEDSHKLVAQMANFCKLFANVEGNSVLDASQTGGVFLNNVCKVFKDVKFVSKHKWTQMIFKIREYTKRYATLYGELYNFTQIVENEGTLEREVLFGSKNANITPNILDIGLPTIDEFETNVHDDELGEVLKITNLSKTHYIAVLVEMEQNRENRQELMKMLEFQRNGKKFIENGFVIVDKNCHSYEFNKVWDEYFVTLIRLSNNLTKESHKLIYERRMFFEDYLYFNKNDQLFAMKDGQILPKCNLIRNKTHNLQGILINSGNVESNANIGICAFCSRQIELGNLSYYCVNCQYSICVRCCDLIISNKTPLRLNVTQLITQIQQQTRTSLEIVFCDVSKQLEYKIEMKITNGNGNDHDDGVFTDCHEIEVSNEDKLTYFIPLKTNEIEKEFKETDLYCNCELIVTDSINKIQTQTVVNDIPIHIPDQVIDKYNCTFTTLNGKGRFGPTNMDEYKTQCHYYDTLFDSEQLGMQLWIVPKTGKYTITCCGAKGGDSGNLLGGNGAKIGSIFTLYKNDTIKIACGQQGQQGAQNELFVGGGGGGGTFFVLYKTGNNNPNYQKNTTVNIPLIVAGGGHGACYGYHYKVNGIDASLSENRARDNHGARGFKTNGRAGRGGSFRNDFDIFESFTDNDKCDYNQCNPLSFLDGAIGGKGFDKNTDKNKNSSSASARGCDGGFGGGGGSDHEGGAGGGYVGGVVSKIDLLSKDQQRYKSYGALSYVNNEKMEIEMDENNKDYIMKSDNMMISGFNHGNGKIEVVLLECKMIDA